MKSSTRDLLAIVETLERRIQMSGGGGLIHTTGALPSLDIGPSVTVGKLALFADGGNIVDVYDANSGQWSTSELSQSRDVAAAVTVGNKAILAGGTEYRRNGPHASNVVDIFNGRTGRWSATVLPSAQEVLSATTLGDKAIFTNWDSVFIYDTQTGEWSTVKIPQEGSLTAVKMVSVGTDVFFLFVGNLDSPSNMVDIYNVGTEQWSTGTLSVARESETVATVGDLAIIAGGSTITSLSNAVDIYNAMTNEWTTATLSQARTAIGTVTLDNLAIFAGGSSAPYALATNAVDIYNSTTGQWSVSAMPASLLDLSGVTIGSEAIFSAGERDNADMTIPDPGVEIYNVGTAEWTTTALSLSHTGGATASVDSTAIFAGGSPGEGESSDVVDLFTQVSLNGSIAHPHRNQATVTLANTGASALPGSGELAVYASTTRSFQANMALQLGHIRLAQPLAVGASVSVSVPISIPANLPAGQYHLIATLGLSHERVQIASTRRTYALGAFPDAARPSAKNAATVFNTGSPITSLAAPTNDSPGDDLFRSADPDKALILR
jgi:hypothetical protein